MAIAHVGSIGTAQSKTGDQASSSLTTSATLEAGNYGLIAIAVDNSQTTDGDEGAVTGVVDSAGNTWGKLGEFCNGQGSAQAGCTISVWGKKVGSALSSGGTITYSFSNSASRDASAASAIEFTVGSGKTLSVEGTSATEASDGVQCGSLNVTTANIECLRVRAVAVESSNAGQVATGGWTGITTNVTSGGSAASNMCVNGEFIISTGTGSASTIACSATADKASIYIALKEIDVPVAFNTDNMFLVM